MQLAARRIRWMCLLCACALADQRVNTANNDTAQTGLGEQCFQDDTCQLHDKHAVCAQVDHNAICKCKQGYHIVTVSRPTNARSSFCAQDDSDGKAGGSSLLGVVVGLLVFSALICFGLRLSTASRPRHFPTTNLYPNKLLCSRQTKASSSKHYGTSDSGAANGQQEDESSAGQSEAKDDETSRVGAARAAAFILISCRPSTSESPTASPGRAKRAKKLGYGRTGSDPAVHSTSSVKTYNLKWYQRDQQRRHSTKNREAKGTPPSHCSTEQLIQNSSKDECSRNSQTALNSKDKSKASSVSRIEHRALVHHSAAAISGGSSGNIPEPTATVESSEQLLQRPEGINAQGTR
ncbi:uncharacterized protein LOC132950206 isoform X1 [Metopolophium dirhodum]|uniref:uncharacterized protein LOC132950206 isoform X1 n=1 Tax=Metopolophium dirhodum TaxID=44670 RepID=UPI0029903FF9|nr:uncharacterized protein LOC132950206 isoform X1 [Metopolophium dirhodum]